MSTIQQINRRASLRKPARRTVKLRCRRGALGMGADLALGFLDISEGGVQLVLKEPLPIGAEVEVQFEGQGLRSPIKRVADIRWMLPIEGGGWCAGVRFQKPLSFR